MLNTYDEDSGIEMPDYLVFFQSALSSPQKKIFIVGASGAAWGFHPKDLERYFPESKIFNAGLGGANISEMRSIVELMYDRIPKKEWNRTIVVLAICYTSFPEDNIKWGGSPNWVDQKRMRLGLYHQESGGIVPSVPPMLMPYIGVLMRPFRLIELISLKIKLFINHTAVGGKNLETLYLSESERQQALNYWGSLFSENRIKEEQFDKLVDMSQFITDHGSQLILVDLPIPLWHEKSSIYFRDYQKKKLSYFRKIKSLPNVDFINLQDLNEDDTFIDSAHPKPTAAKKWASRFALDLKKSFHRP